MNTLTVVGSTHFGIALLGRFAERNFSPNVITINTRFNGDQVKLEHNKNLKRESERTGDRITHPHRIVNP